MDSEYFQKITEGSEVFSDVIGFLKHSDAFSLITKCFSKFSDVL